MPWRKVDESQLPAICPFAREGLLFIFFFFPFFFFKDYQRFDIF